MKLLTWRQLATRYRYSVILLRELVKTDFKVRYQNSFLGYLWSLLRPLFMFVILYFIFVYFLHIGSQVHNWPVALLFGIVMWNFFNEVTKTGLKAIVNQGGLIRKINFPRYIIILSSSLSAFINMMINLVVVAIFFAATDLPVTWNLLLIPAFIIELYVFAVGCAFILSTLYVKLRDINFVWEIILQGGFYATAILYPISRIFGKSHLAGQVLLLSPVTQAIQDARHGILPNTLGSAHGLMGNTMLAIVPYLIVLVSIVFGGWYFRRRSPYFAEDI